MKGKDTAPAAVAEILTEGTESPAAKKKSSTAEKKAASAQSETAPKTKKTAAKKQKAATAKAPGSKSAPKAPESKAAKRTGAAKIKITGEKIFALDIGTRSVIGIVAEKTGGDIRIIATERMEHKTRAMLDGQIHDVLQVAAVIKEVKGKLEDQVGPLPRAAVAAAGRALYTMTAEAEMEVGGIITAEQERSLDFSAVQLAQAKLAASDTIDDPTGYYCVGYSSLSYTLDDFQLKSLIGQRGRMAKASVIATFLPRQVIDSMQSALREARLEMQAITLEPIAAINVLIPPTMRHLNLVLVDIGAGTSDVAITKNGSVIAYGMVPLAGDEITEAISQRFLLDFNVAERIKREAAAGLDCRFSDILGMPYNLKADHAGHQKSRRRHFPSNHRTERQRATGCPAGWRRLPLPPAHPAHRGGNEAPGRPGSGPPPGADRRHRNDPRRPPCPRRRNPPGHFENCLLRQYSLHADLCKR